MKTGVLVNDTNISDLNYHVMSELNNVVGGDNDVFLLTNNVSSRVIKADFAVINSSRVNCVYNGVVVAVTFETAQLLRKAAISSTKVYYIYEMEWLNSVYDFSTVYDTLNDENLVLVCRTQHQKEVIENVFGVSCHVSEFKLGEIWNLLENIKTC